MPTAVAGQRTPGSARIMLRCLELVVKKRAKNGASCCYHAVRGIAYYTAYRIHRLLLDSGISYERPCNTEVARADKTAAAGHRILGLDVKSSCFLNPQPGSTLHFQSHPKRKLHLPQVPLAPPQTQRQWPPSRSASSRRRRGCPRNLSQASQLSHTMTTCGTSMSQSTVRPSLRMKV